MMSNHIRAWDGWVPFDPDECRNGQYVDVIKSDVRAVWAKTSIEISSTEKKMKSVTAQTSPQESYILKEDLSSGHETPAPNRIRFSGIAPVASCSYHVLVSMSYTPIF